MVGYQLRGGVVEITGAKVYSAAEWDTVFNDVRNDPAVPDAALFIIDTREVQVDMSSVRMIDRVRNLRDRLGSKLGPKCALVMSGQNALMARQFQYFAEGTIHLRVGIFTDPIAAGGWLLAG